MGGRSTDVNKIIMTKNALYTYATKVYYNFRLKSELKPSQSTYSALPFLYGTVVLFLMVYKACLPLICLTNGT